MAGTAEQHRVLQRRPRLLVQQWRVEAAPEEVERTGAVPVEPLAAVVGRPAQEAVATGNERIHKRRPLARRPAFHATVLAVEARAPIVVVTTDVREAVVRSKHVDRPVVPKAVVSQVAQEMLVTSIKPLHGHGTFQRVLDAIVVVRDALVAAAVLEDQRIEREREMLVREIRRATRELGLMIEHESTDAAAAV